MHAAHGSSKDEAQMIRAEAFFQERVVRGDHIVIIVLWKMGVHPVAGLRGFPVANAIRKNNEVSRGVQKLPRAKQFVSKNGRKELMTGAARAVKNQDCVRDAALRVAQGFAESGVMQPQFRQRLSRAEFEVHNNEIAFRGSRKYSLLGR